jgi:PiT family inorganic phosphate transporter
MPDWVAFACFTMISLGTMSGGWKIVKTMGTRITKVTPLEGVVAETSGALTLYFTEILKIGRTRYIKSLLPISLPKRPMLLKSSS